MQKLTMANAMALTRRGFIIAAAAALSSNATLAFATRNGERRMYGIIGKMIATPGQRDALAEILLEGTTEMPGCLSYVIALDPTDDKALWITEVWDSQKSHEASLALPSVKAAIAKGRPLVAGFGERMVTEPVGGVGLPA